MTVICYVIKKNILEQAINGFFSFHNNYYILFFRSVGSVRSARTTSDSLIFRDRKGCGGVEENSAGAIGRGDHHL